MKRLIAIIIKEFMLLLRDPAGFILLFILPACFILILSVAMQGVFASVDKKDKLNILVINNDTGDTGNKIINGIIKTGYFNPVTSLNGSVLTLERAKEELSKGNYKIVVNIPADASEALKFEKKSEITIYIDPVLPHDFASNITNSIQMLVQASIIQSIGNITEDVFNGIKKERLDQLNKQLAETVRKRHELKNELKEIGTIQTDDKTKAIFDKLATSSIDELNESIISLNDEINGISSESAGKNRSSFSSVVKNNAGLRVKEIYYLRQSESTVFPNSVQQNVPAWTIFALFWIVQIITINMLTERQSGVFTRIKITPVSSFEIIAGKFIPFFIINLLQAAIMFVLGVYILPLFGTSGLVIKNIPGLILITASLSFAAISFGLLLATTTRTLFFAASFSALVIIIMTIIGGIMVPKFIMPVFMQYLSLCVPQGWALDGYINIFVRDYTVMQILPNVFALLGFGVIFFAVSMIFFRKISRVVD